MGLFPQCRPDSGQPCLGAGFPGALSSGLLSGASPPLSAVPRLFLLSLSSLVQSPLPSSFSLMWVFALEGNSGWVALLQPPWPPPWNPGVSALMLGRERLGFRQRPGSTWRPLRDYQCFTCPGLPSFSACTVLIPPGPCISSWFVLIFLAYILESRKHLVHFVLLVLSMRLVLLI